MIIQTQKRSPVVVVIYNSDSRREHIEEFLSDSSANTHRSLTGYPNRVNYEANFFVFI